jgi:hypothetical protein
VVASGADPEFGRSSGPGEKSIPGALIYFFVGECIFKIWVLIGKNYFIFEKRNYILNKYI